MTYLLADARRFFSENDWRTILARMNARDTHPMIQFIKYGISADGTRVYVADNDGNVLAIDHDCNVLWTLDGSKRAVGFKLSDGMDVPEELSAFKFARQKSKLAGTIRGSFFVIKGEY